MSDRWIKRYSYALLFVASLKQQQLGVQVLLEPGGTSPSEVLVRDAGDLARTVQKQLQVLLEPPGPSPPEVLVRDAGDDLVRTVEKQNEERRRKEADFLENALEGTDEAAKTLAEREEDEERQNDLELMEKQIVRAKEAAKTLATRSEDNVRESPEKAGRTADAEMAAAAIEERSVKLANVTSEQTREARQETAALEKEFKDEQVELVGKLDGMRNKYFKNHPDLDKGQRTDAEKTFNTIKDEATEALRVQQDSRFVELQTQQQDLRDYYEQTRKELDGTRDQRA
jgi:hypothetical protein